MPLLIPTGPLSAFAQFRVLDYYVAFVTPMSLHIWLVLRHWHWHIFLSQLVIFPES